MMNEREHSLGLRRRAEERLRQSDIPPLPSQEAMVRLTHELQVHQIELEIQNEELRQALAELDQSLASYTELYDFAPVGYLTLASNGAILQVNLAGATLLGGVRSQLSGSRFNEWLVGSERSPFADFLEGVFAGKSAESCEVELISRDGRPIFVRIDGRVAENGQSARMVLMDVSQRRQSEQELHKLSRVVEQSPASVLLTDTSGRIEYANPKFTEITGYSLDEVRGRTPGILRSGSTSAADYKDLWQTISQGQEWRGEFYNRKKDGSFYWDRAAISPIRDRSGAITHFLSIQEDITTQKELEEKLQQAQKMEVVGRLAGGVAHDFNNMLGVILGYSAMVLEELEPGSRIYDDLLEIQKAGQRSAELTRQLLAFARRQTIHPQTLDPNQAVASLIKMLQRLIGEDIELLWRPGPEIWPIRMDAGQLDRILANLALNARDAIVGVGRLTIETRNVVIDEAFCRVHPDGTTGRFVLLTIHDTGQGMNARTLGHIFEPFFTTKEVGKGTGLGLSTTYGAVKQSGGWIHVSSKLGEGATFSIYLPAVEADVTPSHESGEPAVGHETILLVEDEASVLRLATTSLSRLGYRVLSAQGPAMAIALARSHDGPIHLLLTDVVMPEMNGRQLREQLAPLYPDLKVLYISGYTCEVISDRGVVDKEIHFLQKPFTNARLSQMVRQALSRDTRA